MKRILIPVGEYTDPAPLIKLTDIIRDLHMLEIILFGVVSIPFATSLEQEEIRNTEPYLRIERKLKEVREFFRSLGVDAKIRIVLSRDVSDAIIEESLSEDYDLIILIKRRKLPRFVRKSISQAILSKIPRPLLILTMD